VRQPLDQACAPCHRQPEPDTPLPSALRWHSRHRPLLEPGLPPSLTTASLEVFFFNLSEFRLNLDLNMKV
jgi:hypothetical protein